MIAILDYDAGNIKSVEKALNHLGQETILTRNFPEILCGRIRSSWAWVPLAMRDGALSRNTN